MKATLRHQNTMLALRIEMGWPRFKPCNDCIGFSSGRILDREQGMELSRISQMLGKDVIYSGWASAKTDKPVSFCVAYREILAVDIVDEVIPFAANGEVPVILVSTRTDESFAIDRRGSLIRVPGRPKQLGKGRKLAMNRIKATAATMGSDMLGSNRWVPRGAAIEQEATDETIARFG